MREASDILATDSAMQIRYLEQISKLADSQNSKIVFFPSEMGHRDSAMSRLNNVENAFSKKGQ
jgi:regulator of protease activity HflC (stomatin/prohibitin superfamily)